MIKITRIFTLMFTLLASAATAEVEVHDPYARSSNAMAGAAFMVIYNSGDTDDRLLSVHSDAAARTQLHRHLETDDGMMQMLHVEDGFVLPAGGNLSLQRGGDHVMFMGLTAPFEQDATITITLIFETAGEIIVEIPVDQDRIDTGAHGDMDHNDMDHGDMDHGEMDHGSDG